jgi:putative mRNA 3-end processing factor
MINNFITKTAAGLYCIPGDFYLDPKKAVSHALVTHAHSDHAVPTRGTVYCTRPTHSFLMHRFNGRTMPEFTIVDFEKPFTLNGIVVTFFPAGHILGSAQILLEHNGERYLYTGDFKTQDDDSCEPFQFVECDHLITETTFASPEYNHPDPESEVKSLLNDNSNFIIGAYALGKAQRLTRLINKHCSGVNIYIHQELEAYHRLYSEHGYPTGEWKIFRKTGFERGKNNVYIVPPSHFRRMSHVNDHIKIFATGWKKSFYRCDRVLQVSDHADWPGVLELITRSKAKKIYTVHGNGNFLKEHFRDKLEVKIIG